MWASPLIEFLPEKINEITLHYLLLRIRPMIARYQALMRRGGEPDFVLSKANKWSRWTHDTRRTKTMHMEIGYIMISKAIIDIHTTLQSHEKRKKS